MKKIQSLTSLSFIYYIIYNIYIYINILYLGRQIVNKYIQRNVGCHTVMSAFEKTKASQRGLESECEFGNAILFRMFRKESLQPWSRGIIWSEIF